MCLRSLALILLLAAPVIARAAAAAPTATLQPPVRGWITLDNDLAYLHEVIDLAPSYDINHIQFSHDLVMEADAVLDSQELRDALLALCEHASAVGARPLIWTHELYAVPQRFQSGGKVDLDDPALWEWVGEKYDRLFEAVPSLGGLVLTMSETQVRVFHDGSVKTAMTKDERVSALCAAVWAACERHGAELYVRTWGNLGTGDWGDLELIRRGIDALPPGVGAMSKHTPGDWYMNARSPMIGAFSPERPQLVEFDLCGEHHGHSQIPWGIPDLIKDVWNHARMHRLAGAVGRIGRSGNHVLGTPNEINLYAFSRILREPAADLDAAWIEWARGRYGPAAAPHVVSALKRGRDIVDKTLYIDGVYFMQNHTSVPYWDYPANHLRGKSGVLWDPAFGPAEEMLLRPTKGDIAPILAEKDDAIALARRSLQDIETAKPHLASEDYEQLHSACARAELLARVYRGLCELYFAVKTTHGQEDIDAVAAAADGLRALAAEIETKYGPDFRFGSPRRDRALVCERIRDFISAGLAEIEVQF